MPALYVKMSHPLCTIEFDDKLRNSSRLTWLPWVGKDFASCGETHRLLIVGESHYVIPKAEEDLAAAIKDHLNYTDYTRDVVWECLVNEEWPNRTLDTLPKLLFLTSQIDRQRFWSNTAFYNFIQTPMHYNRPGSPERPSWDSFVSGWSTFLDVVKILKPSHCLFTGVQAFNSYNHSMLKLGTEFSEVQWPEIIGSTYGRYASLKCNSISIDLEGVRHLGAYFDWGKWNDYLKRTHPVLMNTLERGGYVTVPA